MDKPRVLFVDDEPGIRATLPLILEMNGFFVRSAGTVPEALRYIAEESFDVLLSDLNIGQPGDGFTVVSAMRRTHPGALTVIITGYPAFETALDAIRNQVDEYFVKPAPTEELIDRIRGMLEKRKGTEHGPPPLRRISYILEEDRDRIVDFYVELMLAQEDLPVAGLTRTEIADNIPAMLTELIEMLRSHAPKTSLHAASDHGRARFKQNFTPPMLIEDVSLFRSAIFRAVQANLLSVDVSFLVRDLTRLSEALDRSVRHSIEAHLALAPIPRAS